jgi:hypothetical protein
MGRLLGVSKNCVMVMAIYTASFLSSFKRYLSGPVYPQYMFSYHAHQSYGLEVLQALTKTMIVHS